MQYVFGKTGQVAQELQAIAAASAQPLKVWSRTEADFAQPETVAACLESVPGGSVVINAAAYTAVDLAESESDLACQVNGSTPGIIARVCRDRGLRLIHLSTDYVFDGTKSEPYVETDPVAPVNAYGQSKLLGEQAILATLPEAVVIRTSWVFSHYGKNFVKTMLRLGEQRSTLNVVSDQWGGPTAASSIARTCLTIATQLATRPAKSSAGGIYHYSGTPATNWAEFASEIFKQAGLQVTVQPIPSSEYPTPARRPANSRLDCGKIAETFGIEPPDWRLDLRTVIDQLHH